MAALLDGAHLGHNQRVELYEEGVIWIIDDSKDREIKLDASAATQLLAFLQGHQERLEREARLDRGQ